MSRLGRLRINKIDLQGSDSGGDPSENDWRIVVDNDNLLFQSYDSSHYDPQTGVTGLFTTRQQVISDTIGGINVTGDIKLTGTLKKDSLLEGNDLLQQIITNKSQLDTLLDSGSALDAIGELKIAWETSDSNLQTTLTTLVNTKQTNGVLNSSLIPDTTEIYDIGSPDYKIRDMYVSNNSFWIGDSHKISIDSTGKMKFRKIKSNRIPKAFRTTSTKITNSAERIANNADSFSVNGQTIALADMKMKHWKKIGEDKGLELKDIFSDNESDYSEDEDVVNKQDKLEGTVENAGEYLIYTEGGIDSTSYEPGVWVKNESKIYYDNYVGFGVTNPLDTIHSTGAIIIGNAVANVPGSMRWTGTDFEGYNGTTWRSFTSQLPSGNSGNNTSAIGGLFADGDIKITGTFKKDGVNGGDDLIAQIVTNKTDIAANISTKANNVSPTFTGTPSAPTASSGTDTTQIATTAFVQRIVGDGFITLSAASNDKPNGSLRFKDNILQCKVDGNWYAIPLAHKIDITEPTGYSVNAFTLDGDNATFTMAGAETGTTLAYTITSSAGGTPVTGNVANVASATESISEVDISGLNSGTLTVSVTLTDSSANSGTAVTKTVAYV